MLTAGAQSRPSKGKANRRIETNAKQFVGDINFPQKISPYETLFRNFLRRIGDSPPSPKNLLSPPPYEPPLAHAFAERKSNQTAGGSARTPPSV